MVREISPEAPGGGDDLEVEGLGAARLEELQQTLDALREDSEVAHVLLGLSGVLAEVRSIEDTLDLAVTTVSELFGAERCCAIASDRDSTGLKVLACAGYDDDALRVLREMAAEPDGFPIMLEAVDTGVPIFLDDASQDPRIPETIRTKRSVASLIALPLVRWGQEFGGLLIEFPEQREFTSKDIALSRGIARLLGVALVNARRFSMLTSLRSFGLGVARKLSLTSVIEDVAWGAVELLSGDSAKVYFLDATHESLVEAGAFEGRPDREAPLTRIDLHEEPWMHLLEGRPVVATDIGEDEPLSVAAAPIPGDLSPILGAVLVFFRRKLASSPEELEALSILANQTGMAIENANRYERQRQVARSLQQGLLSTEMPTLDKIEFAAIYEPASGDKDIGGDFYDVFGLPDGRYGVAVGDVSGKGAEAAARTAMCKYMMRAFATADAMPSAVLHSLNNALSRDLEAERFATLVYGVLDPEALKFTIGRAGHPPPILWHAADGTVEVLEDQLEGPVLGCIEEQDYSELTFALSPGDVFVLYTDGLIEARKGTNFYGRRRVEEAVRDHAGKLTMPELARKLYQEAADFGIVGDDTVVFALQCKR